MKRMALNFDPHQYLQWRHCRSMKHRPHPKRSASFLVGYVSMTGGELFQLESQCPDVIAVTQDMMLSLMTRSMESVVSPAPIVALYSIKYVFVVTAHANVSLAQIVSVENISSTVVFLVNYIYTCALSVHFMFRLGLL
jgi:hypothetical protein